MSDTSTLAAGAALYQYQGSAYYIVGYNSKKLPKAVQNYSVTELELFGLVVNIYAFKQLLTNVYFEVFCEHSAIVQILNGKKKLPTRRIQRLIEHLLPFNFTVQYLPGNKMHIADILSRLASKDLEPSDQLIPISFNVHTRSTRPLKDYYASKHKTSIPYKITTSKPTSSETINAFIFNQNIHQNFQPNQPNLQLLVNTPSTCRYIKKSLPNKTTPTAKRTKNVFG